MKNKELKAYLEGRLKENEEYRLYLYKTRKTHKKINYEKLYSYSAGLSVAIEDVLKLLEEDEDTK